MMEGRMDLRVMYLNLTNLIFKFRIWRIFINPIPFTLKAIFKKMIRPSSKRYFKVSNSKIKTKMDRRMKSPQQHLNLLRQSTINCRCLKKLRFKLIKIQKKKWKLRAIIQIHSLLLSQIMTTRIWAPMISQECYIAIMYQLTKLSKTNNSMKTKKAFQFQCLIPTNLSKLNKTTQIDYQKYHKMRMLKKYEILYQ